MYMEQMETSSAKISHPAARDGGHSLPCNEENVSDAVDSNEQEGDVGGNHKSADVGARHCRITKIHILPVDGNCSRTNSSKLLFNKLKKFISNKTIMYRGMPIHINMRNDANKITHKQKGNIDDGKLESLMCTEHNSCPSSTDNLSPSTTSVTSCSSALRVYVVVECSPSFGYIDCGTFIYTKGLPIRPISHIQILVMNNPNSYYFRKMKELHSNVSTVSYERRGNSSSSSSNNNSSIFDYPKYLYGRNNEQRNNVNCNNVIYYMNKYYHSENENELNSNKYVKYIENNEVIDDVYVDDDCRINLIERKARDICNTSRCKVCNRNQPNSDPECKNTRTKESEVISSCSSETIAGYNFQEASASMDGSDIVQNCGKFPWMKCVYTCDVVSIYHNLLLPYLRSLSTLIFYTHKKFTINNVTFIVWAQKLSTSSGISSLPLESSSFQMPPSSLLADWEADMFDTLPAPTNSMDASNSTGPGFLTDNTHLYIDVDPYGELRKIHIMPVRDTLPNLYEEYDIYNDYVKKYVLANKYKLYYLHQSFYYNGVQFKIMFIEPNINSYISGVSTYSTGNNSVNNRGRRNSSFLSALVDIFGTDDDGNDEGVSSTTSRVPLNQSPLVSSNGLSRIGMQTQIYTSGTTLPTIIDILPPSTRASLRYHTIHMQSVIILNAFNRLEPDAILRLFPNAASTLGARGAFDSSNTFYNYSSNGVKPRFDPSQFMLITYYCHQDKELPSKYGSNTEIVGKNMMEASSKFNKPNEPHRVPMCSSTKTDNNNTISNNEGFLVRFKKLDTSETLQHLHTFSRVYKLIHEEEMDRDPPNGCGSRPHQNSDNSNGITTGSGCYNTGSRGCSGRSVTGANTTTSRTGTFAHTSDTNSSTPLTSSSQLVSSSLASSSSSTSSSLSTSSSSSSSTISMSDSFGSCTICLLDFEKDDLCISLDTCKHVFHSQCLCYWIANSKISCPNCRLYIHVESISKPINVNCTTSDNSSNSNGGSNLLSNKRVIQRHLLHTDFNSQQTSTIHSTDIESSCSSRDSFYAGGSDKKGSYGDNTNGGANDNSNGTANGSTTEASKGNVIASRSGCSSAIKKTRSLAGKSGGSDFSNMNDNLPSTTTLTVDDKTYHQVKIVITSDPAILDAVQTNDNDSNQSNSALSRSGAISHSSFDSNGNRARENFLFTNTHYDYEDMNTPSISATASSNTMLQDQIENALSSFGSAVATTINRLF